MFVQLPETLLNEELEVDRRFELCFEELRKGKFTFQAMTLPVKQAWCELLRRWLRRWGAEPAFAVPLPDSVSCKGRPEYNFTGPVHTSNEVTFDFVAKGNDTIRYDTIRYYVRSKADKIASLVQRTAQKQKFKGKMTWNEFIVKFRPYFFVIFCSISFDFVERTKLRSTLLPKTATVSKRHSTCRKNRLSCSI